MALLIDHQSVNFLPGVRNYGPVAVPDGLSGEVTMVLARKTTATPTYWDAGVDISLMSWTSLDGGATWQTWLGFASTGGLIISTRDGSEAAESSASRVIPAGTGRQLKLTLTVTGGRLRSALTVVAV
jgi:hypothetical protein